MARLSQAQCNTLGLNRNFSRAILHGPYFLGGIGNPTIDGKNICNRLNYVLYHLRRNTIVGQKLAATLIFAQLEIGTFDSFVTQPYSSYGHLATPTQGTQIWLETEPAGLTLRASPDQHWVPNSSRINDFPLMELAVHSYNQGGSNIINKCCLYLQVISLYDIIQYDGTHIHPNILKGE